MTQTQARTGDRSPGRPPLRSVEVINVDQSPKANRNNSTRGAAARPPDEEQKTTAQIARLFDLAARENEAIAMLDWSMARLHEVQRAKAALKGLSAAEIRAALQHCHHTLTGPALTGPALSGVTA